MPFKARHLFLGFAVASAGTIAANAFPMSMDIGVLAIDYYSGNSGGGGMANLNYMHDGGVNFYWGANTELPGYAAGRTRNPTFALDRYNTQVTLSAITDVNSNIGHREYCDFIYYGGHGRDSSLYLGESAAAGYGQAFPSQLNLGIGYNRWFLANACTLFHFPNPAAVWSPAFQGLKAMLGFVSLVYDNPWSWFLYDDFWKNWTSREKSLMMSFFDAEDALVNTYLLPSRGLEEGCLSATNNTGWDYCRDFLRTVPHDYTRALTGAGYFYSHARGPLEY